MVPGEMEEQGYGLQDNSRVAVTQTTINDILEEDLIMRGLINSLTSIIIVLCTI